MSENVCAAASGQPTQLDFGVYVLINPLGAVCAAIFSTKPGADGTNIEHWAFAPGGIKLSINDVDQQYLLRGPKASSSDVIEKALVGVSSFDTFKAKINSLKESATEGWLYIPASCPKGIAFPT
jgi:hypothetical protein